MTAKRISGWWYALVAVPIAVGCAIGTWGIFSMLDNIEAMQRLAVPGSRELALEAEEYVIYGETQSVVDGRGISVTSFDAECRITAPDGAFLELESRTASTTYSFGSYAGKSMFDVTVPAAGTYLLECRGGPGVVAIGGGIGAGLGLILGGMFGGLIVGLIVLFVVRRKRKQG